MDHLRVCGIATVLLIHLASCGEAPQVSGSPSVVERPDADKLPKPSDYVAFERAPELISMESPAYPGEAREKGVEGTVHVRVLVGKDGSVADLMVTKGVDEQLDQEAVRVVRTSKWKPALKGKKPVAVWMVIPIEFSLGKSFK